MRLHRITLRDVRAVSERTVHLPDSGVVVVEGPNEIGKSTMLEAFDRLLELKSTSASARARELQPIGQDVGPFVEAEFTLGGHRMRVAKRWLKSPLTELEILTPSPAQFTGAEAEARLEQLLRSSLDTTLWQALRFTQSGDGTVVPLVSSGVLREALDGAANANGHDEGGDKVLDLVEKEYLAYYTARTGRPTGDYKAAIGDYAHAQAEVAEAHRRLVEAETLLDRQGQARDLARRAGLRAEAAAATLAESQRRHHAVAALEVAWERALARLGEARECSRGAAVELSSRRALVTEIDDVAAGLERLEEQRATLGAQAAEVGPALEQAEAALADADDCVEQAEVRLGQVRADRELLADQLRVGVLERLLEDITERAAAVRDAQEAIPQHGVSQQRMREVDRLARDLALIEAKHEAASARVVVQSLGGTAHVKNGAGSRSVEVDWSASQSFVATDDLEVTVPGAVRVRVQPAADAEQRLSELAAARVAVNSALYDLGCRTLEDVGRRAHETEQAQSRLRECTRDLEALLSAHGAGSPEDFADAVAGGAPARLVTERDEVRSRVGLNLGQRSTDATHPPLPACTAEAREAEQLAAEQVHRHRAVRRAAASALADARAKVREVTATLDRLEGRAHSEQARLSAQLAALAAARADRDDEDIERDAEHLATMLVSAEEQAESARLAVAGADVTELNAQVLADRAEVTRAHGDVDRSREVLHTLTGQVELAASEGRQELYDLSVAALDECERRLAALDRRARAVRHLRSTLHEHRDAAHRAYVRPFTQTLERLGRQVYGDTFRVTVEEDLSVRARTVHGTTVPFDQLSGGAKEQLGILARLAVAHLVDPSQGVPVVIDDALGYSDPARLELMGGVFGSEATSGEDIQVILLTCTPQRYAAIPNVHTVRLVA